jgi:hypothetical protein
VRIAFSPSQRTSLGLERELEMIGGVLEQVVDLLVAELRDGLTL